MKTRFLPLLAFCYAPLAAQRAEVQAAPILNMPVLVDCNSPAFWRGGRLNLINSFGISVISNSSDQFSLGAGGAEWVTVDRSLEHYPAWIESVWQDSDGTLYAWYHHEPGGICPASALTMPKIGALVSLDAGKTFTDLGIVLSAGHPPDCDAANGFFAGGHGDFSVIVDREQRYFYFLFGSYGGPLSQQGVAIARMAFEDRASPYGKVWKYYEGGWDQPGRGGRVTPVFPAFAAWGQADANSFWGPSIHWNTHLQRYVVLLNYTCCAPWWPQEGIYVSFNADLSNPAGWTFPDRILRYRDIGSAPGFYPQVLGLGAEGTDTVAGRSARLYVKGASKWVVTFHPE
ncbi:MAG: hypothetical protein HYS04_04190 [Acidobacteria bacterium]|nr:hypothetical protein [Acidobacteriota bacterium]